MAAAGLDAGCDQDCGSFYSDVGGSAVAKGILPVATVDRALARIFSMRFKLGEFDPAADVPYNRIGQDSIGTLESAAKALQAARESIVLLNNSAGVLPLDIATVKHVAVVGPLANFSKSMQGAKLDYSPRYIHTVLDGLVRVNLQRTVAYASALSSVTAPTADAPFPAPQPSIVYSPGLATNHDTNTSLFPAAVSAAKMADVTVVVVGISGEPPDGPDEEEGHDRGSLALPGAQRELVQALLAAVGPSRLVVVLLNGGPVSPDWIKHNVPTVIEGFEGGQGGGDAVAEVLFGLVAPGGILPYTVYESNFVAQVNMSEMSLRAKCGKTYRFYKDNPLWHFGHSLSYTSWEVEWAALPSEREAAGLEMATAKGEQRGKAEGPNSTRVQASSPKVAFASASASTSTAAEAENGEGLSFTVTVTNSGARFASPKVLLFFVAVKSFSNREDQTIMPPKMQLFGFSKVQLHPGQSANVTVTSNNNAIGLCGWCTADTDGAMAVRPGEYSVFVGDGSGPQFPAANITLH